MKSSASYLVAVLAIAACDTTSATGDFTGIPPLRIAGTWTYRFDVIDTTGMATCQLSPGTISFNQTQNGDQFTGMVNGVYTCTMGGDSMDQPAIVPVTVGELAGQGVRFIAFGCIHLGAVTGSPTNHFTGTLNCTFSPAENYPPRPFSGTWEATR